ncbi:MAG: selenite/tellurite reduction operon rhodanese-like protein ExtH [Desulfuromonas thiophila]|jgi:3-mercaptopyruvate sulfurtransferase SseA|nr:selenite/tellurite reduction operon rhodanese-like protein ExtH [Desulfuromonas thiophila]
MWIEPMRIVFLSTDLGGHMKEVFQRSRMRLMALLLFLFVGTLPLAGCGGGGGSDSYDEPDTSTNNPPVVGQTENVLIDAATLKSWVDKGLVNNETGYEKVVILCAGGTYTAGHIPGAQLWSTLGIDRYEGPVLSGNMVLDGPTMDAELQRCGIDERTTVVFAGSGNPARLYFTFRYWGFPKEKLKVLNGNQAAWTAAGYELTTVEPNVTPSTFSVRDLPALRDDVRAALSELIVGVEEGSVQPLNTLLNNTEKAGGTSGIFADVAGDYVIFQGSIEGVAHVGYADFYVGGSPNNALKSADEIRALLESYGIDGSKPIITYCRAGNAASYGFMPIDVALGWDVMVYDGSWSQFGSLTNQTGAAYVPDASYALPTLLSEWATDVLVTDHRLETNGPFFAGPYYNVNFPRTIEKPTFRILDGMLSPYDADANSIEDEDYAYWATPAAGGSDGASSGGGAGGGGC